jgi:PAS domain S-box-containing protein
MPIDDAYRLIVEHAPDALVMLDGDGVVRTWNQAAARIFGYDATEAIGRPVSELFGSDDASEGRVAETEWISRESIRLRKDGTMIHVRCSRRTQCDEAGRVIRQFCSISDLTSARVELDVKLVQARYHNLLESLPDAAVVVNDVGRIVLFNAQAIAMFGHAPAAAIGQPVELLLPPRLRAQHVPQRGAYLNAPRLRPMGRGLELLGLRADGSEFPVEISLSPIEIDGRRMVMSVIRDISDRKRIEQAMQEKNMELERAISAKDRFLATMSHELRTPLNAILGFTGLLLMGLSGPLTGKQERQLRHVQSSGQHLLSLINDLLDLAKIESGRVELSREVVDCQSVVEGVAATLRPLAQARSLNLTVISPAEALQVVGDRRAIHQVLLNLGGNALKFTEQGDVSIEIRAARLGDSPAVAFVVSDTGVGISKEDLERVFHAFVQVGDARKRHAEGTGLGLNLSLKLTELIGGTLTVTSEVGRGSRFTLTLASPS